MLQKTNISGYMKDDKTRIVVNKNNDQLKQYNAGKKRLLKENSIEDSVKHLQNDIADLKIMINLLLKREGK